MLRASLSSCTSAVRRWEPIGPSLTRRHPVRGAVHSTAPQTRDLCSSGLAPICHPYVVRVPCLRRGIALCCMSHRARDDEPPVHRTAEHAKTGSETH